MVAASELMAHEGTLLPLQGYCWGGSAGAVTACMEAVRRGSEVSLEDGLRVEAEVFGRLSGTDDKREGVAAFLEKRAAKWVGR